MAKLRRAIHHTSSFDFTHVYTNLAEKSRCLHDFHYKSSQSGSNRKFKFDISTENICVSPFHPLVSISSCLIWSSFLFSSLNSWMFYNSNVKWQSNYHFELSFHINSIEPHEFVFEDVYDDTEWSSNSLRSSSCKILFRNKFREQNEPSHNSICMASKSELSPTVYARRKQNKRQTTTFC